MTAPEPRAPRVFAPDDPSLIEEPLPEETPGVGLSAPEAGAPPVARPTLSELGQRGVRWGALLVSALAGAACLGVAAWISVALAREDWVGWTTFALMLTAAFAALMLLLRELVGFSRLARLNRVRGEVEAAVRERNPRQERKAALRLASLYARRSDTAWSVRRFREHARDVHDPGELLALADRDVIGPLDQVARRLVTASAKRVATVTALSPLALIAVGYVLIENLRLLRLLATLYGGRPGWLGVVRLARLVVTHMIATGGLALTDDLLGQFLGQDILRRLSRRLGEGAFNGALTARIGVAAIDVIRPLPFLSAKRPRVRDILGEALKPMFGAGKA
jgi:putative membrane protein